MRTISFCLISLLSVAILAQTAAAGPLDDVRSAAEEEGRLASGGAAWSTEELDLSSNFARAFVAKTAHEPALWAAPTNLLGFVADGPAQAIGGGGCASSSRIYLSPSYQKVVVTVVVPHPRAISTLKAGLLSCMQEMRPVSSEILETETFLTDDKAAEATFYRTKDYACRAVIPLVKDAALQVVSRECSSPTEVKALARVLNIQRLNGKLAS